MGSVEAMSAMRDMRSPLVGGDGTDMDEECMSTLGGEGVDRSVVGNIIRWRRRGGEFWQEAGTRRRSASRGEPAYDGEGRHDFRAPGCEGAGSG
jgi:hypothetical protein